MDRCCILRPGTARIPRGCRSFSATSFASTVKPRHPLKSGRKYRCRMVNGSNLTLVPADPSGKPQGKPADAPPFLQIGSDGGLLPAPLRMHYLVFSPGGELRRDAIHSDETARGCGYEFGSGNACALFPSRPSPRGSRKNPGANRNGSSLRRLHHDRPAR